MKKKGETEYRAIQLFSWIYKKNVSDVGSMYTLPNALKEKLISSFVFSPLTQRSVCISKDGTIKWAFCLQDNNVIETVYIPGEGKNTLCLSTQSGCALYCKFCATARMGFRKNLDVSEIVGQVMFVIKEIKRDSINHIVFMGMGEPLLNVKALLKTIDILTHKEGLNFSRRRITVSTAGYVPGIRVLKGASQVNLAVSLNASCDEKRSFIMNINKKYPLNVLFESLDDYYTDKRRRITFEYVLLPGFNMGEEDVQGLARLLNSIPSKVNLIPFNIFPGSAFRSPTEVEVNAFADRVYNLGVSVQVRRPRGSDALAACGQLGASHFAYE